MWITRLTRQIEQLAASSRLIYSLAALYYRQMVQREAELAQIGPEDRVLCIGGGICPYTAILLQEYTGAEVTVIDNDPRCVEQCCRFLRGRGLDGIGVQFGCGTAVHCGDYTVVHLALQVSPREEVLRRVLAQARAGTRILVRVPKASLEGPFQCERRVQHGTLSNVGCTFVLVAPGPRTQVAV